jgi:hypothetical protein
MPQAQKVPEMWFNIACYCAQPLLFFDPFFTQVQTNYGYFAGVEPVKSSPQKKSNE